MARPPTLERQVLEVLWDSDRPLVIREILEALVARGHPVLAYTTVQTLVYRLEAKNAIRRVKKIGNAHIFEAAVSRSGAQHRLIDEYRERIAPDIPGAVDLPEGAE